MAGISSGDMTEKKKQQRVINGPHPSTNVGSVQAVLIKQSVSKGITVRPQWKKEQKGFMFPEQERTAAESAATAAKPEPDVEGKCPAVAQRRDAGRKERAG